MSIKNNKASFIGSIFIGVVLIVAGLIYGYMHSKLFLTFNSAEKMYKDEYYYISDNKEVYALSIYDISSTGITSDDGKIELYQIIGGNGSLYYMTANPNNSKIKSLIDLYDKYTSEEHGEDDLPPVNYLMVELISDDSYNLDIIKDLADSFDPDYTYRNDGSLHDDFYLKNTSLAGSIAFHIAITLVIMAIGIGIIIVALTRKSKNQDTYERLCELDERLRGNIGELENIADYVDTSLGAFVYKDHLILNTKFGFDMFNLKNLVWIYHNITKHKMYVVITVSVDFALQINLYEDGRIREQRVMLTNDKKAEDAIGSLLTYIGMNYPNSIIGFTPEAKEAYREFKLTHK